MYNLLFTKYRIMYLISNSLLLSNSYTLYFQYYLSWQKKSIKYAVNKKCKIFYLFTLYCIILSSTFCTKAFLWCCCIMCWWSNMGNTIYFCKQLSNLLNTLNGHHKIKVELAYLGNTRKEDPSLLMRMCTRHA